MSKYEFVTSHIMRRSFASNYYDKIETPLLMNITGHSKESTFLTYIGTHQNKDALADIFMQQAGVIWRFYFSLSPIELVSLCTSFHQLLF